MQDGCSTEIVIARAAESAVLDGGLGYILLTAVKQSGLEES